MRRYLIIGAVAVVILGVGAWGYFAFFGSGAGVVTSPGGSLPSAGNAGGGGGGAAGGVGSSAVPEEVSARLVRIDSGPVVPGAVALSVASSSASTTDDIEVRYIERLSGNVFSYFFRTHSITRTSDKTVPALEEAFWTPNGSLAFVRYLSGPGKDSVNTYALPADGGDGYFLPQNIADIAVSSTSILSLARSAGGSTATLSRLDGTHSSQVFASALSSLRVSFAGKSQYLAFTKPSATLAGYAYTVSASGVFTRAAGPLNGLVALASPSGRYLLVSYSANGALRMELSDLKKGESFPLPVATIADKCTWTAGENAVYCGVPVKLPSGFAYPDDWYQGAVSFSDRIWKIDVLGRFAGLVLDFPKEARQALDAEALSVDGKGRLLVFTNKNDSSLWAYEL